MSRPLDPATPGRILVRAANWVGDAVMTLPALEALHAACPQAAITVLAKPWVAGVYAPHPAVAGVVVYDKEGAHKGWAGLRRLARELAAREFDWAVLWQNAFEAAWLTRLARIPVRVGYATDGRGWLLSHPVDRPAAALQGHETSYYLHMLHGVGLLAAAPPAAGVPPRLHLDPKEVRAARDFLAGLGLEGPLLGAAPGAAFGPAKCWPAERFAAVLRVLAPEMGAGVLLFGSEGEAAATRAVSAELNGIFRRDLAGHTSLARALALLGQLDLFLCNDSGLMHAAAALGTPTVAVFGSTDPVRTGPLGSRAKVVRHPVDCAPCKKPTCRRDLICFQGVSAAEVAAAARDLLEAGERSPA
ncbi:MAG: lipopolysaccharide heptosyltransferase II [Deltaproteobacteria bacterium]|nr:lipopolysaccharide heptosyltransferase II [Deltaproteobacteria bacterium]